uniref:G-protein coupled receptors family 1 profile domain-containing protein n=1 Tax=Sinocyclocheilus anshuiensis TaxID=1608454 RepID=A0A671PC05_9TELE
MDIHDGILSPFLPIGYIIICCIGLLCNTVTLYIFFLRRQTDSSMTVYMRHLALADTLLVMCLPLRVYYHNKEGPFYLCKVVGIFFYINMYSSILFLSLISLDRYLKIIKPVWTDSSMTVYMRHLALADTLLVMCLPLRVYYHNKKGPFYLCKVVGIFFYINMYSSILFLSLISLDRYLKIIKSVWVRRIQKTKWSHMARFTLCFLPYHAIRIPYVLAQMNVIGDLQSQRLLHILNESALLLSALNSCLDPIIYYIVNIGKQYCMSFREHRKSLYVKILRSSQQVYTDFRPSQ